LNSDKKINLLVIPDLFPKFDGDVQGIFLLDYLKCVKEYCKTDVLFMRLTGKKGLHTEATEDATIHRYCVSSKKAPFFLKPFAYISWFTKGYQIGKTFTEVDIIHAHGSILSGTLSYLIAKKLKVPFIITEHQGPFTMTTDSFWKLRWTRFIMQKANAVLTVSNHLKEEIEAANIHPKKIIVTHNPVDTNLFQLKTNTAITNNILFVGRLDEFKGGLRSLKAFHKIIPNNQQHTFTIVGDGEEMKEIKNYLEANLILKTKVTLTGSLSKAAIAKQLQAADFFVFPSRHESFGLVIAEAMSCGLPVIVGNQTAPKEYVGKDSGLLIPPDDINAIVIAMQQVIDNLSIYKADNVRQHVISNFSFDVFGRRLKTIYKLERDSMKRG
jgi:glycosyltransferase involved in cell wall biosynthesis